jgi:CheY-like chemotaxis protein
MTVETRTERGTILTIVLPGIEGSPGTPASAEPVIPVGLSLLVVEDDPAFRELLKEFLEARGCSVALADGGGPALEELVRRHFDVVLTDLVLPGASGWDVARAAKTAAPGTAVIVMSGDLSPADQRAAGQHADAALTKPIDLVTLSRVIADVAGRASV